MSTLTTSPDPIDQRPRFSVHVLIGLVADTLSAAGITTDLTMGQLTCVRVAAADLLRAYGVAPVNYVER